MSFLSPLALALAGLSVPLLLLYFLKVRRREMPVSSLLLWDPALRDREASTFFQRLQRDPLLILQILALLALTAALARPAITVTGQGNKRVAIVMDSSASMKATDVGPSRFVQAQREALGLLGRLGEGAEVMVIEAGVQPRVVVPFTRNHDQVSSGIRGLEGHDLPNRLGEGIRTARALVGADPRAEVYVFTDGAHPAAAQAQGDDVRIRWVGVGRRGSNVGITGLSVRRNYFGTFNTQAFMSIANFSPEAQTFSLTLTLDGETLAEKTLTLEPAVRRAVVVPFTDPGGGVVRLRLNVSDDLAADNVAYAVLPPQRQIAVTLVSPGNLFLEKALKTDPQVKLEVKKPEEYQGGMEGADVVIVDSASPTRIGNGRFVLVNTVPPDVPLEVLGRLENPVIMDWDRTHPIMRQLDFAKVTIEDAMRVRPLAAGKTLVEAVGRSARVHARGAGSKGRVLRLRPVQDRFPAARGLPAHAVEEPPVAAPGRPRSVEPLAVDGPAHPAPRRARGDDGDRDDPVGPAGQGAGHARGGELRGHGRGRGLHGQHRARRDARGRQPHERRGVRPDAAAAPRLRRGGAGGGAAGPHPAGAVAVLRPARPGPVRRRRGALLAPPGGRPVRAALRAW